MHLGYWLLVFGAVFACDDSSKLYQFAGSKHEVRVTAYVDVKKSNDTRSMGSINQTINSDGCQRLIFYRQNGCRKWLVKPFPTKREGIPIGWLEWTPRWSAMKPVRIVVLCQNRKPSWADSIDMNVDAFVALSLAMWVFLVLGAFLQLCIACYYCRKTSQKMRVMDQPQRVKSSICIV